MKVKSLPLIVMNFYKFHETNYLHMIIYMLKIRRVHILSFSKIMLEIGREDKRSFIHNCFLCC